jgi:DNA gyrase/topoisomerase IV subunit A
MLTARLTAKKGGLAGARVVREGQELLFISQNGMVQRNAVDGISRMGRATQGVRVMNLKKGDRVSAVALVVESENGNGNGAAAAKAPSLEDEAPTATSVADQAAAAEAAGNGEPKVTKAPRRRSSGADAPSTGKGRTSAPKKASAKPRSKAPAKPKASKSAAKSSRPKVKPKHTATAKQRAESDRRKKR